MSEGRRRTTLDKLAEELAKMPAKPRSVARSKRARKKAEALAYGGQRQGYAPRGSRTAPEWTVKSSTATSPAVARATRSHPDGTCHHVLPCGEPALEGRWSCARHTAALEARAEQIRRSHTSSSKSPNPKRKKK